MRLKTNSKIDSRSLFLWWQQVFCLLILVVSSSVFAQTDSADGEDATYRLGPGDIVQVDVFNHPELSGEYTLDGDGRFTMHLIESVEATNLTSAELEDLLVSKLKPDYLVNPRVSIRMQNFRPYYIMGEVQKPDSYAFVDGMTFLTAVAKAGGYTYRGKKDYVYVVRADDQERKEVKLDINSKVSPGDIIRVAERLF